MTPGAAWINDRLGYEERLDEWEHCHWPEGCHVVVVEGVEPEERALGMPLGTFAAIKRLWHSERSPLPARYGGRP